MKKLIMFVFGDITTDARVQRAANALCQDYDVTVLSHDKGKPVDNASYRNVLLKGCPSFPSLNSFAIVWQAFKFIKREKPDIVYAHDYYSALLVRLLIKRKYCKRIIYDAHELIIPEEGKQANRRLMFFYKQEQKIVKRVDLLVCASKERGELMAQHYGLNKAPLVINNISQLTISNDETTLKILNSLDAFFATPGITVVYVGVVSNARKINELLSAVSTLAPQFKLLVVGNGPSLDELKAAATQQPDLVSFFTGGVPYKSLGAILSKCDIGSLYYPADTLNNTYCASNKIYEYASVGLPMMANENPTVYRILNHFKIGISTNDFKNGLVSIVADREMYKKNCRTFTQRNQWGDEAVRLKKAIIQITEQY